MHLVPQIIVALKNLASPTAVGKCFVHLKSDNYRDRGFHCFNGEAPAQEGRDDGEAQRDGC